MVLKYGTSARLSLIAVAIAATVLKAYVLAQCWTWFVVPLGIVAIGKAHVYGLACLSAVATYQAHPVNDEHIATLAADRERNATPHETSLWWISQAINATAPTLVLWLFAFAAHVVMGWQ